MKKTLWLLFSLLTSILAIAQTQQGVVKTRGKMVNGVLQKGTPLSGATVQIKDRSAMVSGNDGTFSFPLRTNSYLLQNVKKNGYQLVDMEICRDHKYSADPLYIVMETPEQQRTDRLAAERKIRRNLQEQLRQKEDEIEALSISMEEKETRLQQLYQQQGDNERLIADMAQRYATLDYDQLDEFYRQVSCFIENGELSRADSLLRTRGDINTQVQDIIKQGQTIQEQKEKIKKAEAVHLSDIDEAAKRCYGYYETFFAKHQNDSAAHYMELRAALDSTNVSWQEEAGEFLLEYLSDYGHALDYHQRALRHAKLQDGEQSELVAIIYNNIGGVYMVQNDNDKALSYFRQALHIQQAVLPTDHEDIALSYKNIALIYDELDDYEKAVDYMQRALDIYTKALGSDNLQTAKAIDAMGGIYSSMGNYERALDYYNHALSIREKILSDESLDLAGSYNNIGTLNLRLGNNDRALEYLLKALHIYETVLGDRHPDVAIVGSNIGSLYKKKGDLERSLQYHMEALKIREKVLGHYHRSTAVSYNNIGSTYMAMDSLAQSMTYHQKALEARKHSFGLRHTSVAESYNNIGQVLSRQGDRQKALDYYTQALNIFEEKLGKDHPSAGVTHNNMGMAYKAIGDYAHAKEHLQNAVDIFEKKLGADHLQTRQARQNLEETKGLDSTNPTIKP